MSLLFCHQLANGKRKVLIKRVGVGLLGFVLTLLSGLKQRMVPAAQLRLQLPPHTMDSTPGSARFLDVMDAILVKHPFEIAAKACALQRFGQKVALERLVLQVFTDISKTLLAVE